VTRFLISFLFIITCSYAQNFNVKEHYYQILLKKWMDNGENHLVLDTTVMYYGTRYLADELLRTYYGNIVESNWKSVFMDVEGRPGYALLWVYGLLDGKQIWFLFSTTHNKLLSTYLEKNTTDTLTPFDALQKSEADYFYAIMLKHWNSGIHNQCPPLWSRWRLGTWGRIYSIKNGDGIDSGMAAFIAMKVANECYGPDIIRLGRIWQMGNNKEHWMIYIHRTPRCVDLTNEYFHGALRLKIATLKMWDFRKDQYVDSNGGGCPIPIGILISRINGHVLFMGEL